MRRWLKTALLAIALGVMLIANLAGEVSASSGIGISPPERRVRISGEGNATAEFLLFNPADTEQQFAVLLPQDSGLFVEPTEGSIGPGERVQLIFTVWSDGNITFEPRIVMHPVGQDNQLLKTGITARIVVEESTEPLIDTGRRSLLSAMAVAVDAGGKTTQGAFFAACALPALLGLQWLRRRRSKKDGKRNKNQAKG